MRLLVTGGCGFIGSNFINHYYFSNPLVHIINMDAMYYCAREENVFPEIRASDRYSLVKGNTGSMDLVRHILAAHQITHVIHFAAQSHVQNSFEDSLQYTRDNILGTHVLLECCRQWGRIERFIHVSTDEVYGESMLGDETKMHEESVLCPTNPYAATKAGAELVAKAYYHSFKMPIIITRGNNVYGPNQYPEKLIPRFIQLLKKGGKVTIQGDGSCLRSFLHVYDVARAFETILHKGQTGEIYNIGGDDHHEYSVMEIAEKLIRMCTGNTAYAEYIEYIPDRPFNDKRYYITNNKLRDLGWEAEWELERGLQALVDASS